MHSTILRGGNSTISRSTVCDVAGANMQQRSHATVPLSLVTHVNVGALSMLQGRLDLLDAHTTPSNLYSLFSVIKEL